MQNETWNPVPGYESLYEVSDLGRVRRIATQRLLSRTRANSGYLVAQLSSNNKSKSLLVHRLVAMAFVGIPKGRVVNHKDGDRMNSALRNLEIVTPSQNERHKRRVLNTGYNHNPRKLTYSQAQEIRSLRAAGWSHRKLRKLFGIAQGSLQRILDGATYFTEVPEGLRR